MKNLIVKVEVKYGSTICDACLEVKELSRRIDQELTFIFNDIKISTENKTAGDMIDFYNKGSAKRFVKSRY